MLLGMRQAREQGQDFVVAAQCGFAQCFGGFADFALARQEYQNIAFAISRQFVRCIDNRIGQLDFCVVFVFAGQRAVEDFDGIGAPAHFQHGRVVEVLGEAFRVYRCRGDDDFQIRAARQELFQVAQQKVNVQAAFVRFVDDNRVVGGEITVGLRFRQQNAVGHQLDAGIARGVVGEAHFIADRVADFRFQFFGNPLCHRARCQTARLGMPDQPRRPAPEFQTNLGQLRGFTRTGFAANNRYLILGNGFFDFVEFFVNGQRVVEFGLGQFGQALQIEVVRFFVFFLDLGQAAVFIGVFKGRSQKMAVFGEGLGEIGLRHDGAIN